MSLLDGREEILVFPQVLTVDADGNPVYAPSPVPLAFLARVTALSAVESAALGQGFTTLHRLTARELPVGAWSKVTWRGRDWDVLGEPTVRDQGSPASDHVTVMIRARTPDG